MLGYRRVSIRTSCATPLTPREVQSFLGELSERVAPGSVVKIHGVLRSALSDAQRLDLVPRNVAKAAKPPSLQASKRRPLTVPEAQRLLAAASGDRLEALFVIALTMGLRRGELLGLRWSDLDPVDHVLRIERAVQRAAGQLRFVEPKSQRSRRVLPVPQVAMAAFNAHRARQARERLAAGDSWHDEDLIFASSIGTPMEPRNVNRRFDELRGRPASTGSGYMIFVTYAPHTCSPMASHLEPSWRSLGIRPSA